MTCIDSVVCVRRCAICRFVLTKSDTGRICVYGGGMPGFRAKRGVKCHAECVDVLERAGALQPDSMKKHIDVFTSTYDPEPSEEGRRYQWLRAHFVTVLQKALPLLSVELCGMIFNYYGVRQYAAQIAKSLKPTEGPEDLCFYVSSDVWASYVSLEGVDYVASLSNERQPSSSLVYTPRSGRRVDAIYVAENHLGIIQVIFGNTSQVPDIGPREGVWWSILRVPGRNRRVSVKSDGVKLRRLGDIGKPPLRLSATDPNLWATPQLCMKPLSHCFCAPDLRLRLRSRMPSLVLNHGTVTGLSLYWGCGMMNLHVHTPGEDLSFYGRNRESCLEMDTAWLYMPLDSDEYIVEIWSCLTEDWGMIMFRTNKGRNSFMGPYSEEREPSFCLLQRLENRATHIYIGHACLQLYQELAFEKAIPRTPSKEPPMPQPLSGYPEEEWAEDVFFTSADLSGVAEVTPCRSGRRIIGLLLTYSNGHRDIVGQVRLDLLEPTVKVGDSEGMWLGYNKGKPRIKSVSFKAPSRNDVRGSITATNKAHLSPECMTGDKRESMDLRMNSATIQINLFKFEV
ncbi:hypothetical protein CDD80_4031 [Ophiocordyceps camponoti-rufipedis]|uniref:Uncharacterized protein n=1 Tax=Ophiocordyceps camponoti-rufipedis TaxID=2004952 RepID=A0A2C5Z0G9_9HYPO|nr:hypothetical protein CDD80_4031 [Ophiocordyceps camponoti-rufipedis]